MSLEERWEARLEELSEFKREHGHCNVPAKHPGGLGRWASDQRTARRKGKSCLDTRRIRKLDDEGFRWAVRDDGWGARLEELKNFRRERGHCEVPKKHPGGLGHWVQRQRKARRHGKKCLDARRIRELDEAGLEWESAVHDDRWDARFEELRKFRREHGHCDVPRGHPAGLGRWADRQRTSRRRGESWLDSRRIRLLEEVGFKWRIGAGHYIRGTPAPRGPDGNEEGDDPGEGAAAGGVGGAVRPSFPRPAEETEASRGGLGRQERAAEARRGETERGSSENVPAHVLRAVDECMKMYQEALKSER